MLRSCTRIIVSYMGGCIEVSEELEGWVQDFESIRSSLMYLGTKRVIHRAHVKTLHNRQIEDGTSIVHRWMQQNYAESMLIGLRRIVDKRKGSLSLEVHPSNWTRWGRNR